MYINVAAHPVTTAQVVNKVSMLEVNAMTLNHSCLTRISKSESEMFTGPKFIQYNIFSVSDNEQCH